MRVPIGSGYSVVRYSLSLRWSYLSACLALLAAAEVAVPMIFEGTSSAIGLSLQGGKAASSSHAVRSFFSFEANAIGFGSDFAAQYFSLKASGEDFAGGYNFIGGLANGIFKNPFVANGIGSFINISSRKREKGEGIFVSFEEGIVGTVLGGALGRYGNILQKPFSRTITISGQSVYGEAWEFLLPSGRTAGTQFGLGTISNLINGVGVNLTREINQEKVP